MHQKKATYSIRVLLWFCFLFTGMFVQASLTAQVNRTDSLLKALQSSKNDTNKVILLCDLFRESLYSNTKEAEKYAKQGLILSIQLDYLKGMGMSYGNIGNCAQINGDYPKALENYIRALQIFKKMGNRKGIAKFTGNIGDIYLMQKKYDDALKYHKEALQLKKNLGDKVTIVYNYQSLGTIYHYKNDKQNALENYKLALEIANETGEKNVQGSVNNGIAAIYFEEGNFEEALKGYQNVLKIFSSNNKYKRGISAVLHNIARVYRAMGKYPDAIKELNTSLSIALEIGSVEDIMQAYSGLNMTYYQTGDIKNAYSALKSYIVYKDSLFNENTQNYINELQEKYEAEKRDQMILNLTVERDSLQAKANLRNLLLGSSVGLLVLIVFILVLYIRNRKTKELKRRIELEQRALRVQMNPHFIFNSLNSIQRMFIEGNQDLANDYMGDFGELLRKILENSGKSVISLKDELDTLKLYLDLEIIRTDDMIEYSFDIDPEIDQLNIFVPPLIIQPFVENAIWHGILPKEEKGTIKIELKWLSTDMLLCAVTDNGIGIEQSMLNKGPNKHKSKGMKITEERLRVANSVKAEELKTGGTKVTILIPLNK